MRALITGMGFVGQHLARYLTEVQKLDVVGVSLYKHPEENFFNNFYFEKCDVCAQSALSSVIERWCPDYIFHLAAQSSVAASWYDTRHTIEVNLFGQLNLFEAVKKANISPLILIPCSSDEYGKVDLGDLPIKEEGLLKPNSPYALSKVFQDYLAYQYFESYGMKIIRTRAFNHTGPGQSHLFVASGFAKQIAEIEKNLREPFLYVGNLDSRRDFTDVRDVVEAYWLVLKKGKIGEVYNICSNKAYSVSEVLDILLSFSKVDIKIEKDPVKIRPSDIPILLGDNSKVYKTTGWRPKIPFEKTLEDVLNYWREKV